MAKSLTCIALILTAVGLNTDALAGEPKIDRVDKYAACVIGRSFIFMDRKGIRDPDKAQAAAYATCDKDYPGFNAKMDDQEAEGLSDYINNIVTTLAGNQ